MVRKILNEAAKKLTNSPTPLLDARVLLSKAINCENALLVFRDLTKSEITTFNEYIEKRMQGIPVSYITGEKEFMGFKFRKNVKIAPGVKLNVNKKSVGVYICLQQSKYN